MSNDYDARILAAVRGESAIESAANDAIHRAFNGLPSAVEEAENRSILRSLGNENATIMGKGIAQGDDYLAKMGMDAAMESLRNRLMNANPKLTAGAATLRVDIAAEAAYIAAEAHKYEGDRLAKVTEALNAASPAAPAVAREAAPAVEMREIRTYTTLDGKESASFEGPRGGGARQLREVRKTN